MANVLHPAHMNEAFAAAFNTRDVQQLLDLYEQGAVLCAAPDGPHQVGKRAIHDELARLLSIQGTMTSVNRFCIELGDLALLSADWTLRGPDGQVVATGSTAEVVRRQSNGRWLYIMDHAAAFGR